VINEQAKTNLDSSITGLTRTKYDEKLFQKQPGNESTEQHLMDIPFHRKSEIG
jgi:hypothetical protein